MPHFSFPLPPCAAEEGNLGRCDDVPDVQSRRTPNEAGRNESILHMRKGPVLEGLALQGGHMAAAPFECMRGAGRVRGAERVRRVDVQGEGNRGWSIVESVGGKIGQKSQRRDGGVEKLVQLSSDLLDKMLVRYSSVWSRVSLVCVTQIVP